MEKVGKRRKETNEKKEFITTLIAKTIYYSINSVVFVASILLVFALLGAIVELCTSNTVICICFLVVSIYSIFRMIIKEI